MDTDLEKGAPNGGVATTGQIPVSSLTRWQAWRAANCHIFPSDDSWRWFYRQHRAELIARKAVCYVAGSVYIVPAVLEVSLIDLGSKMLAGMSRGKPCSNEC